jgi:protein-S-isoprenylcysteine O-methyltransferase Ste14
MNGLLENRIPPPVLVLATGIGMGATTFFSSPVLPLPTRVTLAAAFFLAAGLFGFPAFSAFAKSKTTINPVQIDLASNLVTTGIYGVTRNPMYVALTLLLCGWASWLAQPLAIIGPVAFALFINRFQIVPEERVLLAKFGRAYSDYKRFVRRWL